MIMYYNLSMEKVYELINKNDFMRFWRRKIMKKFGICIIILTIIFVILARTDKYYASKNLLFDTADIINGNYYLTTKENMEDVQVSVLRWYYTNMVVSILLVLWVLTGLLFLYVMGRHVLPYFWYKKYDHIFDETWFLCAIRINSLAMVPTLVYFYILCNNKNYKKASGFLRTRCYERTGFDELQ